jgi:hypothetical protein
MPVGADVDRPVDRPTRLLQVLLIAAVVESFVHYADNTAHWDDYVADDPSFPLSLITRWLVPVSWVLFTVAAVIGYRRFRQGRWRPAAVWLAVYSVSGLMSLAHYVDISLSDLSAFQNTSVFLDVALGVLVLAFAVWTARRPPVSNMAERPGAEPVT